LADYIENYKKRMGRKGKNIAESLHSNTVYLYNKLFDASTSYRVIEVESTHFPDIRQIDARVTEIERIGSVREILLRPGVNLEIGMYVKIDDEWYLLFDKYGSSGSVSLKMLGARVNYTLRWRDEQGILREYKAVASSTDLGSKAKQSVKNQIEWNKYDVMLPTGKMFVFVEKNEHTSKIDLNHRFILGSKVYEVVGIDDLTAVTKDGYGIIQFVVKITTKRKEDDFENKIAHNDYRTITENSEENGERGRLW